MKFGGIEMFLAIFNIENKIYSVPGMKKYNLSNYIPKVDKNIY
jgi:hypothetical protein